MALPPRSFPAKALRPVHDLGLRCADAKIEQAAAKLASLGDLLSGDAYGDRVVIPYWPWCAKRLKCSTASTAPWRLSPVAAGCSRS